MSQSNIEPPNLSNTRITDLQKFNELGITRAQIQIYETAQIISARLDDQARKNQIFKLCIRLLYGGIAALILSIVASVLWPVPLAFIATTSISALVGILFFGFRWIVKHYFGPGSEPK